MVENVANKSVGNRSCTKLFVIMVNGYGYSGYLPFHSNA